MAGRSNPSRLLKYGPPGLGLRSAHGYGCADVCHNPVKVLDRKEDFDIDEVEEVSVNEVVDVTIDSTQDGTCSQKERKCRGSSCR